jgi:hypothetical protein
MVNSELEIYLTDFLNRAFRGKNAKNHEFAAGRYKNPPAFTIPLLSILRRHREALWRRAASSAIAPFAIRIGGIECYRSARFCRLGQNFADELLQRFSGSGGA